MKAKPGSPWELDEDEEDEIGTSMAAVGEERKMEYGVVLKL